MSCVSVCQVGGGRSGSWEMFLPITETFACDVSRGFFPKNNSSSLFFLPLSLSAHPAMEEKRNNSGFSLGTRNLKFNSSCFQVHQTEPYRLLLNFLFIYCHSTMFTLSVYFLNLYDIIRLQSFSQNKLRRFEIKLTL